MSRRSVLGAAPAAALAGLALAGCTDEPAPPAEPVPVDPDVALREAAAEREQALLRSYDAVLAALPELAARLLPVRSHHAEHLAALLGPPASPTVTPTAASPSPDVPAAPAVPPPADAAQALAGLVAQERAAGDAHGAASLSASRSLAGVLASLSASELSHPVALR